MKKGLKKSKWAVSFGSGALLLQSLLLSHSACAAADSTANTSSSSSASDKSGKRDLNAGGTEKSSTDKQGNEKSSADKPGVVGSEKSSGDKTGDLIKVRAEKADTSGAISPEKVNKLLETEDVYGEQFRVSSFIQGNDVTVQTWTNPKSKDPERDERINAVLISKKILDAFPDAVKLCKIRYFDRQDHKKYREFTVVPGVVKSFGAGILTETDLLNTLPLLMAGGDASPTSAAGTKSESSDHAGTSSANSSGAPAGTNSSGTQTSGSSSSAPKNAIASATVPGSTAAVVPVAKPVPLDPNNISSALPGIEQAKRAELLKHILELEKKGVKSPLARQMFVTIEEQVRDGHENEARTSIQRLSSSIESMEKNYQKAKTTKPTPGPVSSRLGGSSPSGSASSGGTGGDYETGLSIIKKKMGDWYPHYGASYVDRFNIGNQILKLQQGGQKVEQYKQEFLQMEAIVINGGSGLEQAIKKFNDQLHLAEAPRDDEYKFQQRLADERKGSDLK